MKRIQAGDNVIDSRDIIKMLEDLQSDKDTLVEAISEAKYRYGLTEDDYTPPEQISELLAAIETAEQELEEWEQSYDGETYTQLTELVSECENINSDWEHGCTLIHESYFVEYTKDLISHCYFDIKKLPEFMVIDWEETSDNLKEEYSEVCWGDEMYYLQDC